MDENSSKSRRNDQRDSKTNLHWALTIAWMVTSPLVGLVLVVILNLGMQLLISLHLSQTGNTWPFIICSVVAYGAFPAICGKRVSKIGYFVVFVFAAVLWGTGFLAFG